MAKEPTFAVPDAESEVRLRELILYIATECQDDVSFGATKLNKILWWSDFLSFAEYGEPITGIEYQRLRNGPAPRRLLPVRDQMVARGDIVMAEVMGRGGYIEQRLVPLRAATLDVFDSTDIATVDYVIKALRRRTARGVSNLSHGKAWEVASDGDRIPYEAVFLSDAPINRSDVARTRELARQLGWTLD